MTTFADQDSSAPSTHTPPQSSLQLPGSAHSANSFPELDEASLLELDRQIEQVKKTESPTTTPLDHFDCTMTLASKASSSSFLVLDQEALDKLDNKIQQVIQNKTSSPPFSHALDSPPDSNPHKSSPAREQVELSAPLSAMGRVEPSRAPPSHAPMRTESPLSSPSQQSTGSFSVLNQATLERLVREITNKTKVTKNETPPHPSAHLRPPRDQNRPNSRLTASLCSIELH